MILFLALWLAWQKSIVDHRLLQLARLEAACGDTWEPYANGIGISSTLITFSVDSTPSATRLPWYRRMFGDRDVSSLCFPPEMSRQERDEIQAAFPEAGFITGMRPPGAKIVRETN